MIVVRSSLTGQTLFAVELHSIEVSLSPADARATLVALGGSPIGHLINVNQSGGGLPVPANCMFGVMACSHEDLEPASGHSIANRKKTHAI